MQNLNPHNESHACMYNMQILQFTCKAMQISQHNKHMQQLFTNYACIL